MRKILSRRPADVVEVWDSELDDEIKRLAANCDAVVLDHLGTGAALECPPGPTSSRVPVAR